MNVLLVADVSIASVIGGAERVVYEQGKLLKEHGHTVHLLTRKLPEHKQKKEDIDGIIEWRYPVKTSNSISFLLSTLQNAKKLIDQLHNIYQYDCIIFHQPFTAFGISRSKKAEDIKKIYICHSLSFEEFKSRNAQPTELAKKPLFFLNIQMRKWLEKKAINSSNHIIVLSRFTQEKLWGAYKSPLQKVTIIPGGIDLKKFHPANDKATIRNKFNIPKDKVIFFTVRNLVHRMGLENLIASMAKTLQNTPDLYLIIGGHGPLKEYLTDMAYKLGVENKVQFTGFISENDLPDYYRMADLFVLPTKELEGFGLVTLEAMASGLPVLGTPVGGTLEIIGKFDLEFLFRDTSPEAIAEKVIEKYQLIKNNPDQWQKISMRCRKYVEANYSWSKHVDELEKIILA